MVDNLTDIVLWNNATSGVSFDDDHGATLTVLLNSSELSTGTPLLAPGMELAPSAVLASPPNTGNSTVNQTTNVTSTNQTFTTGVNQTSTSTANFSSSLDLPSSQLLPSSIDLETLKFGRSQFPSNGTIVLADVSPLQIAGGHVLLNLPNNDTKLVAAHITDTGIEHAIVVPLIKVPGTGKSLYHADLQASMNGNNPYTGKADLVDNVIDIILWNNATTGVSFDDDHGTSLILKLAER